MRARLLGLALAVAGLTAASAARAESYRYDPDRYEPRREVSVFLKGGLGDYTGNLGNVSDIGPTWGLSVDLQPLNIIGVEIAYDASRNHLTGLGNTAALRNGASAMVKLAPPFIERVKPFVGAGLGGSYVAITGNNGGYSNDFMGEIPLAAGLEFNSRSVTAGVRATYRILADEGWAGVARTGGMFDTSLTLGGRF